MNNISVNDLTGKTFGMLTVISRKGSDGNGHSTWNCECECGNECVKHAGQLKHAKNPNCGCMKTDRPVKEKTRWHDDTKGYEYAAFTRQYMWP